MQIGRKQQQAVVAAPTRVAVRRADWQSDRKRNQVGVDDMTLLSTMSNEAICDNLSKRFSAQTIYSYIGNVLISVNPFRDLGIYTEEILHSYVDRTLIEAPPHVYAIAESAVHRMRSYKENQCVIISGESGAGKTEAAKKIMQYIASICTEKKGTNKSNNNNNTSGMTLDHVRDMILATNPLLESFGNAKTLRNNNSSRFGKYIELYFNSEAQPVGAKISNYLLEKSRVVSQNKNERNFHIFYQLCKALSGSATHKDLHLAGPENFSYTSQAGCLSADGIDDVREHNDVVNAFNVIGISVSEQKDIMCILSALLWLGQIKFIPTEDDADKARVGSKAPVDTVSRLLMIPAEVITTAITARCIVAPGGERISSPLNLQQASVVRDAMAKVIYERMFDWIVDRVNKAMVPQETAVHTIGILDIYGFEIFESNSFEQLCINFVNEKLQQIFIELTLKAEQEDYICEGIHWTPIEYFDNKIVCELIEGKRKPGIMAIMNDVCTRIHADSDKADVNLGKQLKSLQHSRFSASDDDFTIKHYAGDVRYIVSGMCEKNRDQTNKDLVEAIKSSGNSLLAVLFPEAVDWDNRQRPVPASEKIRISAAELVTTLMTCHPNYIRCIKPNESKSPREYNSSMCSHQIKYLGLLQNVKVRRAGFASRQLMASFLERYYLLTPSTCKDGECTWVGDPTLGVKTIFQDSAIPSDQWQLGHTKVFIKSPETVFLLEEMREQFWHRMATRVQRGWRRHMIRMERSAIKIQEYWRDYAGNNSQVQVRDFAHTMLGKRKERRVLSLSAQRRFYGDYLDISQASGNAIRRIAEIQTKELIIFTGRAFIPIVRRMRATKMSPRIIVLTDINLRVLVTTLNKKTNELDQSVEKRIPLIDVTGLTMSPYADGFLVVHSRRFDSLILDLPFKTELCAFLSYQTKVSLEINSEITILDEGGKKKRSFSFLKQQTDSVFINEPVIKGCKITVGQAMPSSSETKVSQVRPIYKQKVTNVETTASLLKKVSIKKTEIVKDKVILPPKRSAPCMKMTHIVCYDIEGLEEGELSVQRGAEINITTKGDAGWWYAKSAAGSEGWVPASYIKEI